MMIFVGFLFLFFFFVSIRVFRFTLFCVSIKTIAFELNQFSNIVDGRISPFNFDESINQSIDIFYDIFLLAAMRCNVESSHKMHFRIHVFTKTHSI